MRITRKQLRRIISESLLSELSPAGAVAMGAPGLAGGLPAAATLVPVAGAVGIAALAGYVSAHAFGLFRRNKHMDEFKKMLNIPDGKGLGSDIIDKLARILYDSKGTINDLEGSVYGVILVVNQKAANPSTAAARIAKQFSTLYPDEKPLGEFLKSFLNKQELTNNVYSQKQYYTRPDKGMSLKDPNLYPDDGTHEVLAFEYQTIQDFIDDLN